MTLDANTKMSGLLKGFHNDNTCSCFVPDNEAEFGWLKGQIQEEGVT